MKSENLNQLLIIDNEEVSVSKEVSRKIKTLINKKKELADLEKELKAVFQKEMEARKLKKVSSNGVTVTYIESTKVETFNKDKFREENEKLYNKYVTFNPKKAYVTIDIEKEKKK